MKIRHDIDATTLPRKRKVAIAGAALAAVLVIAPATTTKARHETAKARHDAMHPTTATG